MVLMVGHCLITFSFSGLAVTVMQHARGGFLPLQKLVLLRTEPQVGFSEPLEHFPRVEKMLSESTGSHRHVIQVRETRIPTEAS
jgi:hypothetical protein